MSSPQSSTQPKSAPVNSTILSEPTPAFDASNPVTQSELATALLSLSNPSPPNSLQRQHQRCLSGWPQTATHSFHTPPPATSVSSPTLPSRTRIYPLPKSLHSIICLSAAAHSQEPSLFRPSNTSSTNYGVITATNSSTTNFSNTGTAYFGSTGATTIDSAGDLSVAGNTSVLMYFQQSRRLGHRLDLEFSSL